MKSQQRLHRLRKDDYLLWAMVAQECAIRCHTSTTRDFETVTARVKTEGDSFLTITLANFGKDFEESLDLGYVAPTTFAGFRRRGGLPLFLGGFLEQVFARDSGVLLDDPNTDAILAIRQLSLMYSKILLPCSDAREKAAYVGFVQSEQDVIVEDAKRSPIDLEAFRRVSTTLYRDVLIGIDKQLYSDFPVPKHGPGATADRLHGNAKYRQSTWPRRLEESFPMESYLLPTPSYYEELAVIDILEPEAEIPVRVISVPKTLKTPRIIGIEPTAMQYAQQSLDQILREEIKGHHFLNSFLGLDDQTPNQRMAAEGSSTGELATLDLSEASDRVSNQLVIEMMGVSGLFRKAVQACRSTKADVDGHGIIPLSKFASMGSALTFPIEAMVFLTIIFIGIERELGTQTDSNLLEEMRGRVRVYGDDIIIPVEFVSSVIDSLERFGARVNRRKSFWNGSFRESCGKEYYAGHDVSIVKVRRPLPTNRTHVEELIATVALRNLLYWEGYWTTCQWLDSKIRRILKYFPVVRESSPCIGRESVLPVVSVDRWSRTLHRPEVRGWMEYSKVPLDTLEGSGALLKCFLLKQGRQSETDDMSLSYRMSHLWGSEINEDHLEREGRPRSVDIRLGWTTAW